MGLWGKVSWKRYWGWRGGMGKRGRGRRGVTFGLVVSGVGEGGILPVETMIVPGSGRLKLTGSLGEVCGLLLTSSSSFVVTNLGFYRSSKKAVKSPSPGSKPTHTTSA